MNVSMPSKRSSCFPFSAVEEGEGSVQYGASMGAGGVIGTPYGYIAALSSCLLPEDCFEDVDLQLNETPCLEDLDSCFIHSSAQRTCPISKC
ncbi:hypothetical protein GWI33_011383 [Rhynchophorus ferrugineus]|uniref:Uncharacterized protein n=1 Tax=Rhynchophorus ferrugineus TaxID=354439 RepID=A0A834MIQ1_RHYFE|nr:hypothetical protein GWI33_011383 [Rhynchophorus ferrugineus]